MHREDPPMASLDHGATSTFEEVERADPSCGVEDVPSFPRDSSGSFKGIL